MSDPSCRRCGALVVDLARHEEWHQYHQQQLVRLVHQIDRQQKVTGGLAVRFSSFVNNRAGGEDDGSRGITVDLLAFATYWIGAGMAIGVLAWSVSERRWLPAGAMLLLALGAMYLAYREIRPADRSDGANGGGRGQHDDHDFAPTSHQPAQAPAPPQPAYAPAQHAPAQPPPPSHASPNPMGSYSTGNGQAPYYPPNGSVPGDDRDRWR
jgi:hypothetical protein